MLIAVTVLLVGVVEVAVATTRTVAHRTRELGVLSANGVPRRPVVAALLVEPVVAAVAGSASSAPLLAAAIAGIACWRNRFGRDAECRSRGMCPGVAIAVAVSVVAAVATSIVPTWHAASRPPIRSLTSGG